MILGSARVGPAYSRRWLCCVAHGMLMSELVHHTSCAAGRLSAALVVQFSSPVPRQP